MQNKLCIDNIREEKKTPYLNFFLWLVLELTSIKVTTSSSFVELVFQLQSLKAKLGVFLTGHTVAMVAYYVKKASITCSPMIRHLFDKIIGKKEQGWFHG